MSDLLGIGSSGLRAYRNALASVSDNVANSNTAGYSRRRIELTESPVSSGTSLLYRPQATFGGVETGAITRAWDQFKSADARLSGSDYGAASSRLTWVQRVETPRRKGGSIEHVLCQDADTLRWLSNQNCITPHVWSARRDRLDRPDHIVFDFDPEAGSDFSLVREGALLAGEALRELGLEPFAMVTGSKGIHVIAPIKRTREAPWVRERAGEIGVEIAGRSPDTLTTEWRKEKRDGKILVDTARNTYGQTVVAPYAVRAIAGAPVATPLVWEELTDAKLSARSWTLRTVAARLEEKGDPWADISGHAGTLPG